MKLVQLTSEQLSIVEKIINFINKKETSVLLDSPAGTGKTTLCLALAKRLPSIQFIAPTHKAKNVLMSKIPSGFSVKTICSFLEGFPDYDDKGKKIFSYSNKSKKTPARVLLVEECSMVKQDEYRKLINIAKTYKSTIVFIGDHAQLPPVEDSESDIKSVEDTSIVFKYTQNNIHLTKVLRTDIPEILEAHFAFRENRFPKESEFVRIHNNEISFFKEYLSKKGTILTFHNFKCEYYNREIRDFLYDNLAKDEKFILGEPFIFFDYYSSSNNLLFRPDEIPMWKISEKFRPSLNFIGYTNTVSKIESIEKKDIEICFQDTVYQLKLYIINNSITYVINTEEWLSFINDTKKELKRLNNKYLWKLYFENIESINAPIRYSYSQTVYRAQSDTIENIFVDIKDMRSAKYMSETVLQKCIYTAVSRSSKFISLLV